MKLLMYAAFVVLCVMGKKKEATPDANTLDNHFGTAPDSHLYGPPQGIEVSCKVDAAPFYSICSQL